MTYPKGSRPLLRAKAHEAKAHLLKGESYFSGDLPYYIGFGPLLHEVDEVLNGRFLSDFKKANPEEFSDVNYHFLANKDGRFAWRPFELIHPAIYVSLVNLVCMEENWKIICDRFVGFEQESVACCSLPLMSSGALSQKAAQIQGWWQAVEQQSLTLSLYYNRILQSDVVNCYGTIYTHSIAWALHGKEVGKTNKREKSLLGNQIDKLIQSSRYGQTNGIPQGSVLMDLFAELVLGYVDILIDKKIKEYFPRIGTVRLLRYRDDYRIFTNDDGHAEECLKIVSEMLRSVGLHLNASKTHFSTNVVEMSVKTDKFASLSLQFAPESKKLSLQKQMLMLHRFGQSYPNSGSLRRLVSDLSVSVRRVKKAPPDLTAIIAIAVDIAVNSPAVFPGIAAVLSHLISLVPPEQKLEYWSSIYNKMEKVPYNGFLQIWLQRVTKPKLVALDFNSSEPICQIVNGKSENLWNNDWIRSPRLKAAVNAGKIVLADASNSPEIIKPKEVSLFSRNRYPF